MKDWHKTVYAKKEYTTMNVNMWRDTRNRIIERDKFTCQRCKKHHRTHTGLSAHHIVPRAIGGQDDDDNLITLCNKCHDWIELRDFRTAIDIIESGIPESKQSKTPVRQVREETFSRPDWHKYVYGGQKRK